ncbi:transporter, major facilitator family protein [Acanthamoeba castellanii str. Neff]|uniref:Transporter, major facilitator family protein n=1 Tax=Acanthamoeba castellanii (strain ATCC 30010 / Neff) TaxID=1257118 RepID=L8GZM3_ACACF|nr:transporter, major facilitator family protein [Acanthamoeba castellanii str. Neff]ELR17551.1 transporter, major facilitator family protein [Acanthamoeba castellanii str. Neff]
MAKLSRKKKHNKRCSKKKTSAWMDLEEAPTLKVMPDDPDEDAPPKQKPAVPIYTEERVLEIQDPYEQWVSARQRILLLVAIPALLPPITQTMYLPTINEVIKDLNTNQEMVAWTLSIFALGNALFPMSWGSISDRYGRRTVLLACLSIFFAAAAFSACAWSVYALIFGRIVQSLGLSAAGVVGAGSLADVYPPAIRGNAMGWYTATVLMGTVIGPVLGGFVGEFFGWRAIFWSLAIAAATLIVVIFFFLPETLNKSGPKRSANPIHTLKFFLHPPLLVLFVLGGAVGGCMLLILFIFPIQMNNLYGLNDFEIGLAYVPFGLGTVLGTLLGGKAADLCFRYKGLGGRLVPALLGALGMIAALMVFAWTIEWTFWLCMVSLFMVGFFLTFTRPGFTTFAIEQRPRGAASVQACFYSFHNLCGFVVLNAGPIIIEKTSIRWAFSGYSLLIVAICVPLFFLLCSWTGIYKVEDMGKSNSSGSGSSSDELVLSETTPLKQVVVHVAPSR